MSTMFEQINSMGKAFFDFAGPMLIQSSVLILILLVADLLLRKNVRAVFRYWIWMLVLVKLILPTSLSLPMSFGYWFGDKLVYAPAKQAVQKPLPVETATAPLLNDLDITPAPPMPASLAAEPLAQQAEPLQPVARPAGSAASLSWQGVAFLAWLVIAAAMALLLLQRALFVRALVAQARAANRRMNDILKSCREDMQVTQKIDLKVSANATSPAVCGLFRPVILVPENLALSLNSDQLRTVLMHELAHIKRGDLWVNLVQTFLQIMYFYNPLLWLANAIIRRAREQAVDEMVLVAMGRNAQQYPQTLVDVARLAFKRPALSLRLIGVVESRSALKGRIKHILNRPIPKTAKLGILGLITITIIAAVLLPMAAAEDRGQKTEHRVEKQFAATLPNGVRVELTGLCEHPSEGKKWWRPDGSLLQGHLKTREKIRCSAHGKPYEFVIEVKGPEGISWTWGDIEGSTGKASIDVLNEENGVIETLDGTTAYIDAELQKTSLRIAVASGEWITKARPAIKGKGMTSMGSAPGQGSITLSQGHEFDEGVKVVVSDDYVDSDHRIIAIDQEGNTHIAQMVCSSAGNMRQTIAHFQNLKLDEVKEYQFQTRPYQWVAFKNVSLRPDAKTDVQIQVEKAAVQAEVEDHLQKPGSTPVVENREAEDRELSAIDVVKGFMVAALSGAEERVSWFVSPRLPLQRIKEFQQFESAKDLKIAQVYYAGGKNALAAASVAQKDKEREGLVSRWVRSLTSRKRAFSLFSLEYGSGGWRIYDINFRKAEECEKEIEQFYTVYGNVADEDQNTGSKLGFRIVPNIDSDRQPSLSREAFKQYCQDLQAYGPDTGTKEYQWMKIKDKLLGSFQLTTYKDQEYILVCSRAPYVMLPVDGWGLQKVYRGQDPEGKPIVCFWFDNKGGEFFYNLTKENLKNFLAILIDDKVVLAPTIQTAIRNAAIITGHNFNERDVEKIAIGLQIGMRAAKTAVQVAVGGENKKSDRIILRLIDPNSHPVVGARVGTYVDWSDVAENPPIWFLNEGRDYKAAKVESDEQGKIVLAAEDLFSPEWPTERTVPLIAIDKGHFFAGLCEVSREHLGGEATLALQPVCRVHGQFSVSTFRRRGWSTHILTLYTFWNTHKVCQYTSRQRQFEFLLPPGLYEIMIYSDDPTKAIRLPVVIKPGQKELDISEYLDNQNRLSSAKTTVQAEVLTDSPPVVLDLDSGKLMRLETDWPDEYDVGWDNDEGGSLFAKPDGTVRMLPIAEAKNFADALSIAPQKIESLKQRGVHGVPAQQSRYILIETSQGSVAVVEIEEFDESKAKIRWQTIQQPVEKTDVQVEPAASMWEDVGKPIPPDFNDTMTLAEHITLTGIGQDAEGKAFVACTRDAKKTDNRAYRFLLVKKDDSILEPSGYGTFGPREKLQEKFSFDVLFIAWQIKEFRFQGRFLHAAEGGVFMTPGVGNFGIAGSEVKILDSGAPPGRYVLSFDGVDDYLFVPFNPNLTFEAPFTVELWIKPEFPKEQLENWPSWGLLAQGCYTGTGKVKTKGFGIKLERLRDRPESLFINYCTANAHGIYATTYSTDQFDDWMHIYHVFSNDNYEPAYTHPLVVGRFLIPAENAFKGHIGEIRIWNGARSRQEIAQYKNVALTGKEPGLAACWTFEQSDSSDESDAQFVYDISPGGNHARLGSAPGSDDADPKWVDLQISSHRSMQTDAVASAGKK